MQINITYPEIFAVEHILFYSKHQWMKMYPNLSINCTNQFKSTSIYLLNTSNALTKCESISDQFSCSWSQTMQFNQSQWWYFILGRCQTTNITGLYAIYTFKFFNGHTFFTKQFSAEELGLLELFIIGSCVYTLFVFIIILFAYFLCKSSMFHVIFKLFIISVVSEYLYVLFNVFAYLHLAITGIDREHLKTTGCVWDAIAQITFLLILILCAKRYTITQARLSNASMMKLFVFFLAYTNCYMGMFVIPIMFIVRPSKVNVNFPFHAKTNQICATDIKEQGIFAAKQGRIFLNRQEPELTNLFCIDKPSNYNQGLMITTVTNENSSSNVQVRLEPRRYEICPTTQKSEQLDRKIIKQPQQQFLKTEQTDAVIPFVNRPPRRLTPLSTVNDVS
ncbi:unnamed protein product [Didymodactylos carnosus]|uniref:Intimal thickness related receptor IRP domain-containing protein n=1 Tax=Didymodactylos carnosus TaxID=1234261 RepID=A0A813WAB1_9BILA|nr:unnamed protein product [Didymodactylos carnosus]CAF1126306.1 unnamed protein product [Didymodactylos carnosus]CAF3635560.1 unnamed protein product [Didymodactylos carnosus]CAF3904705.1 unnamed protein product [Didymodactylos carnosus]